jgi:hypothetical protein
MSSISARSSLTEPAGGKENGRPVASAVAVAVSSAASFNAAAGLPLTSGPVVMLLHYRPLVYWDHAFWCRRSVAQATMWPDRVVMTSPAFDQDLSFAQGVEYLAI